MSRLNIKKAERGEYIRNMVNREEKERPYAKQRNKYLLSKEQQQRSRECVNMNKRKDDV